MPTYTYECGRCGKFDVIMPLRKSKQKLYKCPNPECAYMGKKVVTAASVQCDSVNDVVWLPKALENLPEGADKAITTRSQYKRYLKQKGIVERG